MAGMKKLSNFRQLSLNCDNPTPTPPRRPPLRKQFSEDISDFKAWPDHDIGIKISLNNRSLRNPFIKNAWIENAHETLKDEPVIIKKCSENRRTTNSLVKQGSLERESINARQELADRLKASLKSPEEKPNIKIFLAQNSNDQIDEYDVSEKEDKICEPPKLIQPLTAGIVNNDKNSFKLRKHAKQKNMLNNAPDSSWPVPNKNKNTTQNSPVVVVPVSDNEMQTKSENQLQNNATGSDVKAIDSVIIRPVTAASKREMFQKRTNSAFNATVNIKETQKPRRPLIRSSSAPCKPEHLKSKMMLTKHNRHKSFKKVQLKTSAAVKCEDIDKQTDENPKSQKELNRTTAVQGNDVVTMVSLISPTGSDGEEEEMEEAKTKNKNTNNEKSNLEPKPPPKIMSLRKAVKTVSFQQSSIHAIRSFSASFPARRASVTAAMMLNNSLNTTAAHGVKLQEKRGTNSSMPDDDERVPKRRLVRSNTEDPKTASFEQPEHVDDPKTSESQKASIGVTNLELKSKDVIGDQNDQTKLTVKVSDVENPESTSKTAEDNKSKESEKEGMDNPDLKSPKEKQCWNMYCKMAEKGINISFDTILRGMLTPTEYRLSKKNLLAATCTEPSENPK